MTQVSSVQSLSRVQLFATQRTAARQASLSITNSQRLLKLMPIESEIPSNHLILCHTLLHPPSIFPSIRVFSNESALRMRWPKYWTFSFSISPSNEYSGLINSLLFSFPYSPTVTSIHDHWKNHSLELMDLCCKVMSLLFNMLSRVVISFLPRSKCLLFMAAVTICSDFGAPPPNKVSHCFPINLPLSDGAR